MRRISEPLEFFQKTITPEYVDALLRGASIAPRAGIYTGSVVVWLMIAQRMQPNATLAEAVRLIRTERAQALLDQASARVRKKRIGRSTGGYSQARTRIPLEVVESIADRLNEAVLTVRATPKTRRDVFVLDGTTVRVTHTKDNLQWYPQYENQYGRAHYPLVRICVATNPETGVTVRPSFGPYSGRDAVSEIGLANPILERLPKRSIVIADRYFGCFRFVNAAKRNSHDVICRLKEQNAQSLIGGPLKGSGEESFEWAPSAHEQKLYPELVTHSVKGKIVWCPLEQTNKKKQRFVLFTTLDLPVQEIFKLYRQRWNVETDLRDIKTTLAMNFIDAKTPDMIAKEIILGLCAFNLIRHMITTAAIAAKLKSRRFSFTAVIGQVHAIAAAALADVPNEKLQTTLVRELTDFSGLLLPTRASPRFSEPRKVWQREQRTVFVGGSSRAAERSKLNRKVQRLPAGNS